jgi:1,3-beta-glucanosyltransferase GAS5
VRGIDYQPGGSSDAKDPLADTTVCQRDIAEFKKLGVNTVRVYITDNSANHDTCMNALADAGIYVIIDANNPLYSINRFNPGPSYNTEYLQSVFATIDEFAKYDNTLAFFSGNEVINDVANSTLAARYVKATTRDMRQYIGNRGYRKIPVGYSAADVSQNRMQLAAYMNCGTDDERSDFFAFVSVMVQRAVALQLTGGRTTIRGATRTFRCRAGTRRLRTSLVTASPSCKWPGRAGTGPGLT